VGRGHGGGAEHGSTRAPHALPGAASDARLRSILAQLPLRGLPARALDVGCGAFPSAEALRETLPGWTIYGLDRDGEALRRARQEAPFLRLIRADARDLPGLLRATFGLIVVRHPDLFRYRAAWSQIIAALPGLLAPGGALLIALHAPEEVEIVRALDLPPALPLDDFALPPADLAGHDRFALAYRRHFPSGQNRTMV
jgi:SAM-dependent methyltransferase